VRKSKIADLKACFDYPVGIGPGHMIGSGVRSDGCHRSRACFPLKMVHENDAPAVRTGAGRDPQLRLIGFGQRRIVVARGQNRSERLSKIGGAACVKIKVAELPGFADGR
jgi:hypothetical protein